MIIVLSSDMLMYTPMKDCVYITLKHTHHHLLMCAEAMLYRDVAPETSNKLHFFWNWPLSLFCSYHTKRRPSGRDGWLIRLCSCWSLHFSRSKFLFLVSNSKTYNWNILRMWSPLSSERFCDNVGNVIINEIYIALNMLL